MSTSTNTSITVEATVNAPIEKVWSSWTEPKHITQWNQASPDWHCPAAENDVRTGGSFKSTMAARDGSMSFEFGGTYTNVQHHKVIEYGMGDGRKVKVQFAAQGNTTTVTETFDAESENPVDMQRDGWQAILNNFKKHTEGL